MTCKKCKVANICEYIGCKNTVCVKKSYVIKDICNNCYNNRYQIPFNYKHK